MSKPWISDARQRRSKKYRELHEQLQREIENPPKPKPEPEPRPLPYYVNL